MKKREELNSKTKKLALLDMHAIIHRAYHALPDFSTSKAEPTGALYGLVTMILKLIGDTKPDYIVACYDLPQATYRHELYDKYKEGRAKTDEALVKQIIRSRDVIDAFGIPRYELGGFEADDLLGTIVEQTSARGGSASGGKENIEIIIATGDMDSLQLVSGEKVRVYTLKKGIKDTIIYDEKGVRERFGFGPELLPDYKGLRGDPSDNIPGIKGIGEKTGSILIQKFGGIEEIYKKLKSKNGKAEFLKAGIKERIVQLLLDNEEEANFSKMLGTIRRDAPMKFVIPEKPWKETIDVEKVKKLFSELEFRTLGVRVEEAVYGKLSQGSFLSSEPTEKVDEGELRKISLALWVLNSDITHPTLEDILSYSGKKTFAEASKMILEQIKAKNLTRVYEEIELPLIHVIEKMEKRGVKIDTKYLSELSKSYHGDLQKLEQKIWKLAGMEFNINSPKQLGEVLFDKLQLQAGKKTAGGAKSTRESELEKLRSTHPIIEEILQYRELQKLLSTYIDTIPELLGKGGRLHAKFLQDGAVTGRMASQNPNLQNIPIKTELGRTVRKAFIAEKGFVLLDIDYSQIELRVAAFLSGDKNLIKIFTEDRDIHSEVAAQIFKVASDKVTKEMRRQAKVINFGILYGMGVNALRANLGTDRETAAKYLEEYFKNFSGLAKYLEKVKAEAKRLGHTETYFGRQRQFPDLKSHHPFLRATAERMAMNAPMQGTQADIIKLAMIQIDKFLEEKGLAEKARMLIQVHDELLFEVEEKMVKEIAGEIQKIMENVIAPKDIHGIVCKTNASVGQDWDGLKSL